MNEKKAFNVKLKIWLTVLRISKMPKFNDEGRHNTTHERGNVFLFHYLPCYVISLSYLVHLGITQINEDSSHFCPLIYFNFSTSPAAVALLSAFPLALVSYLISPPCLSFPTFEIAALRAS